MSLRSGTGWAYYFPSTPSSVLSCVFCLLLSASAAGTRFIISPTHCSFGQHTLISVSFCPGGLVHSYTWFHLVPHSLMLNGSAVCVCVCVQHTSLHSLGSSLLRALVLTRLESCHRGPVYSPTPEEDFNPGLIYSYQTPDIMFPVWADQTEGAFLRETSTAKKTSCRTLISVCSTATAGSWSAVSDHFSLRWEYDRVEVLTEAFLLWCSV